MPIESWLYKLPLRLRSLFRRSRVEQDLRDEILDHIERQTALNIAGGTSTRWWFVSRYSSVVRGMWFLVSGLRPVVDGTRECEGLNLQHPLSVDSSHAIATRALESHAPRRIMARLLGRARGPRASWRAIA